ncbi:hypothetical protein EYF80_039992 [Liparis tanakae]|uniref:Uncharacterized protein n=1 Tax=Liparis tanakae TaxID=230148 RepID=A0A4Z2G8M2_9TELE|nr:hypothetical protein EYF80_039992 [Liparis tanakae]
MCWWFFGASTVQSFSSAAEPTSVSIVRMAACRPADGEPRSRRLLGVDVQALSSSAGVDGGEQGGSLCRHGHSWVR